MALFIFADSPISTALAARVSAKAVRFHSSGNCWIASTEGESVSAWAAPDGEVVACGRLGAPASEFARIARGATELDVIDFPGVDHAVVAVRVGRRVRMQASVAGITRAYWAVVDGVVVGCDSASALARLLGARLDDVTIAMQLTDGVASGVLDRRTAWRGVHAVPAMSCLIVEADGTPVVRRWWHPPQATQDVADGAAELTEALFDVLRAHRPSGASVSADLSGGLDSSSLVYTMAELGMTPRTFHARSANPWNDDLDWARRAADDTGSELLLMGSFAEHSRAFDTGPARGPLPDSPPTWSASLGYLEALAASLGGRGPNVHVTGIGGDELFGYLPAFAWSLRSELGRGAWPVIERFRRLHRWPLTATARAVVSRRTPSQELLRDLAHMRRTSVEGPAESLAWNPRPVIAPWVSDAAEDVIRMELRAAADDGLPPLDEDRGRHQVLESLQFQGRTLQQMSRSSPGRSTAWEAPFLVRTVIEAAMRVRVSGRFGAGVAKPLLASATAGYMPEDFFTRSGKGEYSLDVHAEFRRERHRMLEYFHDSELVGRGLVDFDALASVMDSPVATGDGVGRIERLVSLERWLRQALDEQASARLGGLAPTRVPTSSEPRA